MPDHKGHLMRCPSCTSADTEKVGRVGRCLRCRTSAMLSAFVDARYENYERRTRPPRIEGRALPIRYEDEGTD